MSKCLTYEEAATRLNVSLSHLRKLLRDIKAERFSDAPRAPYVITEKVLATLEKRKDIRKQKIQL